jgi:WS/DGAT/MGAT family acyltransferase
MAAPRQAASALGESVAGIARLARRGLTPASSTPLNPRHIGAFRRFDTARFDLAALKAARTRLGGGTINDVTLAAISGALRRTLLRRGVDVDRLRDIRALVPVNVRPAASRGALGNFVALVFANLPVDVADPRARYARVRENTAKLNTASREVESSALLERIADATATVAVSWSFYLAAYLRAFNFVVTNVPGPPMPLYLAGARLLEVYPLVPLFRSQTLGVALMSYAGSLFVGINADWHAMPDLHDFARDLEESVAELCALGDGTDVTTTSSPSAHCPPPT